MTTLMKPLIGAGVVAGSVVGAYKGFEGWYDREREARLQPGALEESTLPYYDHVLELAEQYGLVIAAAGGIVKQALIDPETDYDLDSRRFTVSENPNCHARSKATLYRGRPELTLRDMDWRVLSLLVPHETEDIWVPALSGQTTRIRDRQARMQEDLDRFAQTRNFRRGPELSLFPYEDDFDIGAFPCHRLRNTNPTTATRFCTCAGASF